MLTYEVDADNFPCRNGLSYHNINIVSWDFQRVIIIWNPCWDLELLLTTDRSTKSKGFPFVRLSLFGLSRTVFLRAVFAERVPFSECWQLRTNWKSILAFPSCIFSSLVWVSIYNELTVLDCWHRSEVVSPPCTFAPCRLISFMFIQLKLACLRETEMVCHLSFLPGHAFKQCLLFYWIFARNNLLRDFICRQPGDLTVPSIHWPCPARLPISFGEVRFGGGAFTARLLFPVT